MIKPAKSPAQVKHERPVIACLTDLETNLTLIHLDFILAMR